MSHKFLEISKKIQSIAQIGLTYANSPYDVERYEELRKISFQMLSEISNQPIEKIADLFEHEKGYQTPKVDVRGIVFRENKILLVQERSDLCWTPPGGWAEIGLTPFENCVKEVWEESGLKVKPERLIAVWDKKSHTHPPSPWYTYKIIILCTEIEGTLQPSTETLDAAFFDLNKLPPLSTERITKEQIELIYKHCFTTKLEILCD